MALSCFQTLRSSALDKKRPWNQYARRPSHGDCDFLQSEDCQDVDTKKRHESIQARRSLGAMEVTQGRSTLKIGTTHPRELLWSPLQNYNFNLLVRSARIGC